MKIPVRIVACLGVLFLLTATVCLNGAATAAEVKIGVIHMQKVVAQSEKGKAAKAKLEAKMEELKNKFKADEEQLIALQKEIEKKSSAWSDDMKQEKAIEFQKKRRDLGVKQEDANLEIKKMQDKLMAPILKDLEKVVKSVAVENGYTLILPRNTVLFAAEGTDISTAVTEALDKTEQ